MIVIGLTGNIGTGKSTVAGMLKELGAAVLDADKLGHEILKRGEPAYGEVVAEFGEKVLAADGEIDREKLAKAAFANREALDKLNAITHPRIFEKAREIIEGWRRRGVPVAVVEAPLLVEAGWTMPLVDRVWVTAASEATILRRLKEGRGTEEEAVLARLRRQMPPGEKLKAADVVIDTNGSLEQVREQVVREWGRIVRKGAPSP
jgi:dephospho-CoA kinase